MVPREVIDEIRDRVDIVRVIGEAIPLKKAGRNYVGLCPFHGEKTPSFSVSQQKQLYYCFGCGEGGTVFTFLMKYHHQTFPETLDRLAQMAGVDLSPYQGNQDEIHKRRQEMERFEDLMAYARDAYHKAFATSPVGGRAREYMKHRGISWERCQTLKLGYAPEGWSTLTQALERDGKSLADAERLGLIVKKKGKDEFFDQFRDRLLFPIENLKGKVVGFGGRVLGEDQPKYLNSPQTPLFDKGSILYGLNRVIPHLREEKTLFVVEGYMDQVSLEEAGVLNVVATLGTALTEAHAKLLKRHAQSVTLVFDGDEAGLRASRRSMRPLLAQGVSAKVMLLPKGEDPDSYVKKVGRKAFLEESSEAVPILNFFLTRFYQEERDLTQKANAIAELVEAVSQSETVYLKEALVEEASRIAGLDKAVLRGEQKLPLMPPRRAEASRLKPGNQSETSHEEWILLRLAAEVQAARARLDQGDDFAWFQDEGMVEKARKWLERVQEIPSAERSTSGLVDVWEDDQTRSHLARAFLEGGDEASLSGEGSWEQVWHDCVKKLRQRRIRRLKCAVDDAKANGQDDTALKLLQQMVELKQVDQQDDEGRKIAAESGRLG